MLSPAWKFATRSERWSMGQHDVQGRDRHRQRPGKPQVPQHEHHQHRGERKQAGVIEVVPQRPQANAW